MIATARFQTQSLPLFRWRPNRDLLAVALTCLLVTSALYTATVLVGVSTGGGLPYFGLYAIVAATLCGVGLPLWWTVAVRRRPISDLGLTTRRLGISIALQLVFAGLQFSGTLAKTHLPPMEEFVPLVALALTIGFFEALFWRGWVLTRLEAAFGLVPAVLLGSLLYALYHVGYAMPLDEMAFLFVIGIMFAVAFRLTGNVFILWPVFQPMGQLVTLTRDRLTLPFMASVGFLEVLVLMGVLVWLAARYHRKHGANARATSDR
jgi:uncharacterized protein